MVLGCSLLRWSEIVFNDCNNRCMELQAGPEEPSAAALRTQTSLSPISV